MKKTAIIAIFLLVISGLCGCINLLTTYEKQICLDLTHYSTTEIPECTTQSKCYEKINSQLYVSSKLQRNLQNDIAIYKNNVASSTYYFNSSKDFLDKVHAACNKNDTNSITNFINDLFFNISNLFKYSDLATERSIITLKDYAIYLQKQEVDKIPEEPIYDDFIIVNQNLNDLQLVSGNTYVAEANIKAKEINDLANKFGFKKTYVSNVNYIDLTAYYFKIINAPANSVLVPKMAPSMYYLMGSLSKIETLRVVTQSLKNSDNYNLYILMNTIIGNKNSLYSDFAEINSKINSDIDKTYEKINQLNSNIDVDKNYLANSDVIVFEKTKQEFRIGQISIGAHLAELKRLELKVNSNKLAEENATADMKVEIVACDKVISLAKGYKNIFLNEIIDKYENTDNYLQKLTYCEDIKINTNDECLQMLSKFVSENKDSITSEYTKIDVASIDYNDCVKLTNTINYKLSNHDKIIQINNIIAINRKYIDELMPFASDNVVLLADLAEYSENMTNITKKPNFIKILNADEDIKELVQINTDIINLMAQQLSTFVAKNITIETSNTGIYYVVMENPFSISFENVVAELPMDLTNLICIDYKIRKQNNRLTVSELHPGRNLFEIKYNNQQEITTTVLFLTVDNSILVTTITNTVIGICNKIHLDVNAILISPEGAVDNNGDFNYITDAKNTITYYKKIVDKTIVYSKIDKISDSVFIEKKEVILKNISDIMVEGDLAIGFCEETDTCIIKNNGKVTTSYMVANDLYTKINLKDNESKIYEIDCIKDMDSVTAEMQDLLARITALKNSRFLDIKKEADAKFSNVEELFNGNYSDVAKLTQITQLIPSIESIENKEVQLRDLENSFSEIYAITLGEATSLEDLSTMSEINDEKYSDIAEALTKIQELKNNMEIKTKEINEINEKDLQNTIEQYKLQISKYDLNSDLYDFLDSANKINLTEKIAIASQDINKQLKNKVELIQDQIFKSTEISKNADSLIEKCDWLYESISLPELFAIGYYPIITPNDIDRFKKKIIFLDSVTLNNQISEFEANLVNKNYALAIDSVPATTISRLSDIITEDQILETGLTKIKEDAEFIVKYDTKNSKLNSNLTETANNLLEKEKFLDAIYLVKSTKPEINTNKLKNIQITIIVGLIIIFLLVYLYFNQSKRKQLTSQEKKLKVIRHK